MVQTGNGTLVRRSFITMSWAFLLSGFGLGLAYAAAPGVVNTECLRRGMTHGFRSGFTVQLGALMGDGLWAVLALSGVAALANNTTFTVALSLIGGGLLCRLAFSALRAALVPPAEITTATGSGHFRTGIIFGLANPAGLAFWAGIGGGLLTARPDALGPSDYALFL